MKDLPINKATQELNSIYSSLAQSLHPDRGGNKAAFANLRKDYESALSKVATPLSDYYSLSDLYLGQSRNYHLPVDANTPCDSTVEVKQKKAHFKIRLKYRKHPKFVRDGNDLYCDGVVIDGTITVQHPNKKKYSINVPATVSIGDVFIMTGLGVTVNNNLYVKVVDIIKK